LRVENIELQPIFIV